ncbi:MAG TPA: DNA polymerase/3'-5' exonuclease PolX [Polyangia bacterium]|jgi:DNA polymerase (family 10)
MPVHNAEIAEALTRLADLLEIEGANQFRVRAYRTAARTVQDLPRSVESLVAAGEDLSTLPGIGADLAAKLREFVQTRHLGLLDEVQARLPEGLAALLTMPGLGPKRVALLYQELHIDCLDALTRAAGDGRLQQLRGFGEKTAQKIVEEARQRQAAPRRLKLSVAEPIAVPLRAYLAAAPGVEQVVVAGSFRRRCETVGDLDVLVTCARPHEVMDRLVAYDDVTRVLAKGDAKSTVLLRSGLQVDVRVVPRESYGAASHYFTGSKMHNIAVRTLGVKRGLKINEYGVFRGAARIAGATEEEVFAQVDLPYIEPELREDHGEVQAAAEGRLPRLITLADLRGDLHVHTKATDGKHSLQEMVFAARQRGYEYVAITDHTRRVFMAKGLDAERLAAQCDEIDRLNAEGPGVRVLKAAEVDILEDGALDLPDSALARLDLRLCSVHYNTDLPRDRQTERVLRAMDNPLFNIFAHPTGRLIGERPPYEIDLERILLAARERGCFVELDAHPDRLDLCDLHLRLAKELGVKVAISTDAHKATDLELMRYGVDQARRGWLEPGDVLNTRSWAELAPLFRR